MIKRRSSTTIMPNAVGELELLVLSVLWRISHGDVKTVCKELPSTKAPTLNTVQSTLERLYKKKLVTRQKHRHAFIYQAKVSRSELMGKLLGDVLDILHDGQMETILSSFVSVAANLDDDALDRLEELIAQKKLATQEEYQDD